jgi:hypothetical protein
MRGWLFTAAALTVACTGAIAGPQLKGRYGITGAAHCVHSSIGFNSAGEALCGDTGQPISFPVPSGPRNTCPGVFANTSSVEAIRIFNGNGTGTGQSRNVTLTVPPNGSFIGGSSDDFSFSFTYTVDGGGGFTSQLVPGSFVSNILTGPRAGQTMTVDQINLEGLISNDKKTLVIATVEPTVERQQFSNGDVRYRICHRSRTLIWMGNWAYISRAPSRLVGTAQL